MPKSFVIQPGQQMVVSTGLQVSPPKSHYIDIRSRSSAQARGLICSGVIDGDFRGTVSIIVHNVGSKSQTIQKDERIAQMIVTRIALSGVRIVESLDTTERNQKGFGSTGV